MSLTKEDSRQIRIKKDAYEFIRQEAFKYHVPMTEVLETIVKEFKKSGTKIIPHTNGK